MIEFDDFRGMYLISWFPCVVTFRVSFPFDQVLELFSPAMTLVVVYLLHFVLFFAIN